MTTQIKRTILTCRFILKTIEVPPKRKPILQSRSGWVFHFLLFCQRGNKRVAWGNSENNCSLTLPCLHIIERLPPSDPPSFPPFLPSLFPSLALALLLTFYFFLPSFSTSPFLSHLLKTYLPHSISLSFPVFTYIYLHISFHPSSSPSPAPCCPIIYVTYLYHSISSLCFPVFTLIYLPISIFLSTQLRSLHPLLSHLLNLLSTPFSSLSVLPCHHLYQSPSTFLIFLPQLSSPSPYLFS